MSPPSPARSGKRGHELCGATPGLPPRVEHLSAEARAEQHPGKSRAALVEDDQVAEEKGRPDPPGRRREGKDAD